MIPTTINITAVEQVLEFNKLCLQQHLAQAELDAQKNLFTTQDKVFDSLRTSLLAKLTEPMGVFHKSPDGQEK